MLMRLDSDHPDPHPPLQHNMGGMSPISRLSSVERYSGESEERCEGGGTDVEKRMRREIANSNERRRMQSINVGFQSLRALLPKRDGEKMSKASILQQTADYVVALEKEKARLERENQEYKALLESRGETPGSLPSTHSPQHTIPPKKRRRYEPNTDSSSSDEGAGSTGEPASPFSKPLPTALLSPVPHHPAAHHPAPPKEDLTQMRAALEREMASRKLLEDQVRSLELSRLHGLSRLQPALLDYSSLLNPYSLGLLPPPPPPSSTTIAHPAPIKPTLLLGGTSSLSPTSMNNLYNSMLQTSTGPMALQVPTVPATNPTVSSSFTNSKQSLEVIVEAIRHLEGDSGWAEPKVEAPSPRRPEFASPLARAPVIVPN